MNEQTFATAAVVPPKAPRKGAKLEKVEYCIDGPAGYERRSAACVYEGARYHVNLVGSGDELKTEGKFLGHQGGELKYGPPVLYKNPVAKKGEPGYFEHTRHLDSTASFGSWLIAEMFRVIEADGLIAKSRAEWQAGLDQDAAEEQERIRRYRIKSAALELHEALEEVQRTLAGVYTCSAQELSDRVTQTLMKIEEALLLAEEGKPEDRA